MDPLPPTMTKHSGSPHEEREREREREKEREKERCPAGRVA